jgi:hypothetical protein
VVGSPLDRGQRDEETGREFLGPMASSCAAIVLAGRLFKKLQRQGAQRRRSEAYFSVRRNDEGDAQRSIWTFCEAVRIS